MPPLLAHTPMASTQRGSGIWSEICRRTGAIFWLTRPATIIRSACRGEARKTSMPKRARSYRPAPVAIISMAQQASPKVAGHSELLRDQLTTFSTLVRTMPLGIFSSRPMACLPPSLRLVPLEPAATPDVGVGDEHGADEQGHLDQAEQAQGVEGDGPRDQEDHLDVEDDEEHGGQVELHREPATAHRLGRRLDAALVGVELRAVVALGPDQ